MSTIITLFFTVFGLLIGSFLNALIYRLPRGINIAFPRSSCTSCKKVISWYENIPVLSYSFLLGKCSSCKSRISIEYPIVEIITALFAYNIAPGVLDPYAVWEFMFFFSVFCVFLVHFMIDLKHQILPDSLNVYLAVIFSLFSLINFHWTHWAIGVVIGFGFPLLVSWIFFKLKGQVGLGGGDIKLFGVLGIYLGPIGIIQNIFLSCFLGAVVGLGLIGAKLIKRDQHIPFGPFILAVGAIQIFTPHWFKSLISYIP